MNKQPEDKQQPKRRHLQRLDPDRLYIHNPVYYITMISYDRKPLLTTPTLADAITCCLTTSPEYHKWAVGQYIIMPDHLHFLCRDIGSRKSLSDYIRDVKKYTASQARRMNIAGKLWQAEFFDRVLRSHEAYGEKCEYIRMNPERAKLVKSAVDWPWQGMCEEI